MVDLGVRLPRWLMAKCCLGGAYSLAGGCIVVGSGFTVV